MGKEVPLTTLILASLLVGLGTGLILEKVEVGALAGVGTGLFVAAIMRAERSPFTAFVLSILGTLSLLGALTLLGSLKIPVTVWRVAGAAALISLGVIITVRTLRR